MDKTIIKQVLHCPFTGLGLYNGFRGNHWLANRIKIFKQFVIPSLQAQTNKNFILWLAWRPEEKTNRQVWELRKYMDTIKEFKTIFTFSGICFYDDKYPDDIARERLIDALQGSMGTVINAIEECDYVLFSIQPSDDLYHPNAVETLQTAFKEGDFEAVGFKKGYIANYQTLERREYNPTTNPPFYTIKFPRAVFIEPLDHCKYTSIKKDVGKYKAGCPIPSHEYVGDALNYLQIDARGFTVGVHSDNISTQFNNPFASDKVSDLKGYEKLKIPFSLGRLVFNKMPYSWKRKLRFWAGEKKWILRPVFNIIYNLLRR